MGISVSYVVMFLCDHILSCITFEALILKENIGRLIISTIN